MRTNATQDDLHKALVLVNQKYAGNIRFKRMDQKGNRVHFTLTVHRSRGPGGRLNHTRDRHISAACWHVHGHFFEELFALRPDAIVRAATHKITKDIGNWIDRNIGSHMYPCMYSDACNCGVETPKPKWELLGGRSL
jgi:hypothetical protein